MTPLPERGQYPSGQSVKQQPVHILLAEDDRAFAYLLRKALTLSGLEFELTIFEDACSASAFVYGRAEYATRRVPDLVILDVSLPKGNGDEILEAICQTEQFASAVVVVMSAFPELPERLRNARFAFARYVPKPKDLEELKQVGELLKSMVR